MCDLQSQKFKKVLSMIALVLLMLVCNSESANNSPITLKKERSIFQLSIQPVISVSLATANKGVVFAITLGNDDE